MGLLELSKHPLSTLYIPSLHPSPPPPPPPLKNNRSGGKGLVMNLSYIHSMTSLLPPNFIEHLTFATISHWNGSYSFLQALWKLFYRCGHCHLCRQCLLCLDMQLNFKLLEFPLQSAVLATSCHKVHHASCVCCINKEYKLSSHS